MVNWLDEAASPAMKQVAKPAAKPSVNWMDEATAPRPLDDIRANVPEPPFLRDPQRQAAEQLGEPPQPNRNLIDRITGRDLRTPETDKTPEIGQLGSDPMTNLRTGIGMLASSDPKQIADIIKSNYPDATFDQDEKGNIFVTTGGKRFQFDKPGINQSDILRTGAEIAQFLPAAKLGSFAKTGLRKVAASATGAAATSLARDATAMAVGAQDTPSIPRAAMSMLGEAAFPMGSALTKKIMGTVPMEPGELTASVLKDTMDAGKATGIDLFPAQKTGLEDQLLKQRLVSQLPGGAQIAAAALKKQNSQAYDATINYLDSIAPAGSVATGARRFRTAAETLNENIKRTRSERASPIYKDAFGEGVTVDTTPVVQIGKGIVDMYPAGGQISSPVAKAVKMINAAGSNLEKLHNVKVEIDQMLDTGVRGAALRGTARRELMKIKNSLLESMDASSPKYAQARQTFEDNSGLVNEVDQSVLGDTAAIKDRNLKSLTGKIFDAQETNPEVIKRTRELIDTVDPGAYDELLRSEMERRIGKMRVNQEGVQNVPGQIWGAVYGNEKQRQALYAALRPEQRYAAQQLEMALQAASKGRAAGSQSIAYSEAKREMTTGPVAVVRDFIASVPRAVSSIGEDAFIRRKTNAIAKVLYDPSFNKDVDAALRMMKFDPNSGSQQLYRILQAAMGAEAPDATGVK